MFRKRRQPAPFFRMPGAPYNPATGQRAPLGRPPISATTLATFQVIGDDPNDTETQDTHANYVVCRGYEPTVDPSFRYLHDPYTAENTTSIKVAKPYALRGKFPYKRGQIVVAARIRTNLGENQGKASTTVGHPADLDEGTEILLDDEEVAIAWLDISTSSPDPKQLYYYINQAIEGFDGTGTSGKLKSGNLNGWVGTNYVVGSEDEVGIEYTGDATPSSNGNFLIHKTGLYAFTWWGTGAYTLISANEAPILNVRLYRKPSGGSMDEYTDVGGGTPCRWAETRYMDNALFVTNGSYIRFPFSHTWIASLEAEDTIAFKFLLSDPGTSEFSLVASSCPLLTVEYLSGEVPEGTAL